MNRIKHFRLIKEMTLEALADRAGTSAQQISRLENGKRKLTLEWMERIAPQLDVRPVDLIGECADADAPRLGETLQDADEARLIGQWRALTGESKGIAMSVISNLPKRLADAA